MAASEDAREREFEKNKDARERGKANMEIKIRHLEFLLLHGNEAQKVLALNALSET
jgi:hypothetical protein